MNWLRRRIALWRMRRRISDNLHAYENVEELLAAEARHTLAAMVEAKRNSPAIVEYRRRRAIAIRDRPLRLRASQIVGPA